MYITHRMNVYCIDGSVVRFQENAVEVVRAVMWFDITVVAVMTN